jgi:peptide/nickel transport system permease protein
MREAIPAAIEAAAERHESYVELVWRRFRKSKPAIVGGLMILTLAILGLFAEFFSPNQLYQIDMQASFTPPHRIRFIDGEGNFHLRPFVYAQVPSIDMTTFEPIWEEDTTQRYEIQFLSKVGNTSCSACSQPTCISLGSRKGPKSIFLVQTS